MCSGCTFDDFFPSLTGDPEVVRIRNRDSEWAMKVWVDIKTGDEDCFLYPLGWFGEESEAESEVIIRAERGDHRLYVEGHCWIRGKWRKAAEGVIDFRVDSRMNGPYGEIVDIHGGQLKPLY